MTLDKELKPMCREYGLSPSGKKARARARARTRNCTKIKPPHIRSFVRPHFPSLSRAVPSLALFP
jgi:hypothetical protein